MNMEPNTLRDWCVEDSCEPTSKEPDKPCVLSSCKIGAQFLYIPISSYNQLGSASCYADQWVSAGIDGNMKGLGKGYELLNFGFMVRSTTFRRPSP